MSMRLVRKHKTTSRQKQQQKTYISKDAHTFWVRVEKKLIFYAFYYLKTRKKNINKRKKHKSVCICQKQAKLWRENKVKKQAANIFDKNHEAKQNGKLFVQCPNGFYVARNCKEIRRRKRCGIKCNKRDQIVVDLDGVKVPGELESKFAAIVGGQKTFKT